jgi:hypothetical protein
MTIAHASRRSATQFTRTHALENKGEEQESQHAFTTHAHIATLHHQPDREPPRQANPRRFVSSKNSPRGLLPRPSRRFSSAFLGDRAADLDGDDIEGSNDADARQTGSNSLRPATGRPRARTYGDKYIFMDRKRQSHRPVTLRAAKGKIQPLTPAERRATLSAYRAAATYGGKAQSYRNRSLRAPWRAQPKPPSQSRVRLLNEQTLRNAMIRRGSRSDVPRKAVANIPIGAMFASAARR